MMVAGGVAGSQSPFEPGATPMTIRRDSADSVIPVRNPGCALSPTELRAVRAGVGTGFVAGNAYLYHYFKRRGGRASALHTFSFTPIGTRNFVTRTNSGICMAVTISLVSATPL